MRYPWHCVFESFGLILEKISEIKGRWGPRKKRKGGIRVSRAGKEE